MNYHLNKSSKNSRNSSENRRNIRSDDSSYKSSRRIIDKNNSKNEIKKFKDTNNRSFENINNSSKRSYKNNKDGRKSEFSNKYGSQVSSKSNHLVSSRSKHGNKTQDNFKKTNTLLNTKLNNRINNDFGSAEQNEGFSNAKPVDLLWGRHTTEAALKSGRPIHRIWCTSELRSSPNFFQLLRDSKASGVLVEEVSWSRLGQITKGAVHQGIALQIAASKTLDLKNLIEACKSLGDSSVLLALDGLTDPHNLGAIVRSAEALGAHGLVLPQRRSAGLTGSVAKVAAGALEHLPVARVVNLNRSLEQLKQEGYRIIGLAEEGDVTLHEIDFDGPLVVVAGSEDKGISLLTRRVCDQLVRIPLRGFTPSLNASVATSIFLYEVARNRWMGSISGQAPSPRVVKPQFKLEAFKRN